MDLIRTFSAKKTIITKKNTHMYLSRIAPVLLILALFTACGSAPEQQQAEQAEPKTTAVETKKKNHPFLWKQSYRRLRN